MYRRRHARNRACLLTLLLLTCWAPAAGQVSSRAEEIEAAREEKSRQLEPESVTKLEERLIWIKDAKVLERISAGVWGFRVKLGGMATGEGFAVGPEYYRADLARGRVLVRSAAQVSAGGAHRLDSEFAVPRFAGGRLFTDVYAVRHGYRSIQYYGPGPDSVKTGRSNYLYEDVALDGTLGARLGRYFRFGGSVGHLRVNTGPGASDDLASAEMLYGPDEAPGIDEQTHFARYGAFGQMDYRDDESGPRAGGHYLVQYDVYDDTRLDRYGFRRLDIDLQQYIPFFNRRRVIALRGKAVLTDTPGGQAVPFYMQPVVGGSDDLRGFRSYRFHDDNSLVLNAEYRFETFAGLDTVVFADGGKVFPHRGQLNFSNLEGSAGFGLRFNARNAVFLRIDVGFSHEGAMLWVKFGNIFAKRPIGRSSPEAIF